MPDKQFVQDLTESEKVSSPFAVQKKEIRQRKDGRNFISLLLADKTGSIPAVMWDNVELYVNNFNENDIVNIVGTVSKYDSKRQVTVNTIGNCEKEQININDFIPQGNFDIEELWKRFRNLLNTVNDKHLKILIEKIFDDEAFADKFKKAPAAIILHHGYIGGLLEHTLSITSLCSELAEKYNANRDILVTAAALHDIGKVEELNVANRISYSDEGRFIGHLAIADSLIKEKISSIDDFPHELEMFIRHCILSHHGELEWGSAKRPKTIEALILHHADNLDAKITAYRQAVEKYKGSAKNGARWTDSRNIFGRNLFIPPRRDDIETVDTNKELKMF